MEALDRISGIIGYALIKAEDGSVEEVKGSPSTSIGDLTAFFSSAGEVIRDSLSLGRLSCISLCYGAHRLVIFPFKSKYIGAEVERENEPKKIINNILSSLKEVKVVEKPAEKVEKPEEKPKVEIPRSISSKIKQINLLVDEFGGADNKEHWIELLNQGLGILGGEIIPFIGVIEKTLTFKDAPPEEKEDEFVQGLRSIIDFLVKKAVEEMGSSQARARVQSVIEKMR